MGLWSTFLGLLQSLLFATTHLWGGSVGFGIVMLSLTLRVLLLPVTYAIARDSSRRALRLERLRPQLLRLQRRYAADRARLAKEQLDLYGRHGIRLVEPGRLLAGLMQLPLFAGMYAVIRRVVSSGVGGRWLWVADIAKPDALLALLVAALVGAGAALAPHASAQVSRWLVVVPAVALTGLMLLKMSAGIGLYWGASSAVGVVQSLLVRRAVRGC